MCTCFCELVKWSKEANEGVTGFYALAEVAATGGVAVMYKAAVVSLRSPASPVTQLTSFLRAESFSLL